MPESETLMSQYAACADGTTSTLQVVGWMERFLYGSLGTQAQGGAHGRQVPLWNRGSLRLRPSRLHQLRGCLLPRLLLPARIGWLLRALCRSSARTALAGADNADRCGHRMTREATMQTTCECALLHAGGRRGTGCRECEAPCCPSCAIEIDSHTYCRWCALGLAPVVSA